MRIVVFTPQIYQSEYKKERREDHLHGTREMSTPERKSVNVKVACSVSVRIMKLCCLSGLSTLIGPSYNQKTTKNVNIHFLNCCCCFCVRIHTNL
jgi:hypothetical protein